MSTFVAPVAALLVALSASCAVSGRVSNPTTALTHLSSVGGRLQAWGLLCSLKPLLTLLWQRWCPGWILRCCPLWCWLQHRLKRGSQSLGLLHCPLWWQLRCWMAGHCVWTPHPVLAVG
uniref:Putative secreted protein n=1 Tax=Ixodes ricinus TaxID=34613 RepID=A0A147BDD4_IXORI